LSEGKLSEGKLTTTSKTWRYMVDS